MLRRTIHTASLLSDLVYGRKISRQLNKGEPCTRSAATRTTPPQGTITRAHPAEQAWCLTLLTNAVVAWTTEYCSRAVRELRSQGRQAPDEILSHISPGHKRQRQLSA